MTIVIKEYLCPNCGEIERSQEHDQISRKCWICKSPEIERRISVPIFSKNMEPRTVGTFAEKNGRKNPLTREKQFGQITEKKLSAETRLRKISRMTPEQKQKYIEGRIDV